MIELVQTLQKCIYMYKCIWIIGLLRVTVYVVIEDYYFIY